MLLARQNRLEASMEQLRTAMDLKPEDAELRQLAGRVAVAKGDLALGVELFELGYRECRAARSPP